MKKLPVCQTEQIITVKNHLEWLLIKEYLLTILDIRKKCGEKII